MHALAGKPPVGTEADPGCRATPGALAGKARHSRSRFAPANPVRVSANGPDGRDRRTRHARGLHCLAVPIRRYLSTTPAGTEKGGLGEETLRMSDDATALLVARISALERQLRQQEERTRLLEHQIEGLLRTPFRIRTAAGQLLLEVTETDTGARLRLHDGSGRFLVTLGGMASGGTVVVHSNSGAEIVGIASGPHGGTLGISTPTGELVAWLNATESGGHVVTRGPDGRLNLHGSSSKEDDSLKEE